MKDRITLLIKAKNYTAAQFADEIGVQKSSISHILSGRNNASLDFVQKILLRYPEVNMDWLMFGKGPLLKDSEIDPKLTVGEQFTDQKDGNKPPVDLFSSVATTSDNKIPQENDIKTEEEITKTEKPALRDPKELPAKEFVSNPEDWVQKNNIDHASAKSSTNQANKKQIQKIVIFYTDNTFREFDPE